MTLFLANADALHIPLADKSVHMIATSPPYWGLRDYGLGKWVGGDPDCAHVESEIRTGLGLAALGEKYRGGGKKQGQVETKQYGRVCQKCEATRSNPGLGLEPLHDCLGWARGENCGACYVCRMRLFGAECWRVLRDDGVMFLNLGDSYASQGGGREYGSYDKGTGRGPGVGRQRTPAGKLKPKDLCMIPARVALALQADGFYLRSDIIWSKSNPMPESVTDRPTKAHEYIFLLAKRTRYFYDADAVREDASTPWHGIGGYRNGNIDNSFGPDEYRNDARERSGRNQRTVWNIATTPYPGAHFACFPPALVEPMIKAGTSERGCCPECGAQWERVTEKGEFVPMRWSPGIDKTTAAQDIARGQDPEGRVKSNTSAMVRGGVNKKITVEWRPTCSHAARPVPCTVLDPFAGSGTTGQVARHLGRHAVLLDLSFPYLQEQAKSRLELDRLEAFEQGIKDPHDYSDLFLGRNP